MRVAKGGERRPLYFVGQLVHHKHCDYRGVIVSADPECRADDAWYLRNPTQPDRKQPWYHVLVDGGRETYVAEENLEPDILGKPINHPLVARFFPTFSGGRYYRQSFN